MSCGGRGVAGVSSDSDRGLDLFPESFVVEVLLSVSLVSVVLQKNSVKMSVARYTYRVF